MNTITAKQYPCESRHRAEKVDAAVRMVMSRGSRQFYAGNATVQVKPDFFHIDEPEPHFRKTRPADPPFPARAVPKRQIRDGAHVGHNGSFNPLSQHALDPLAETALKVKDPVAYHVYKNQRPWITQSSLIGEHSRPGCAASAGLRVPPRTAPASSSSSGSPNKRETLRMLRASATRAIGAASKPGDLEAVSPTRGGYIPSAPRGAGDMATLAQLAFVDPRTHPEPATCKAPKPEDRLFYSKHPTDTSARDAVDHMCTMDGTLKPERPAKVHPAVWVRVKKQEKALSMTDPHAHKRHTPGWMGTLGGQTVVA